MRRKLIVILSVALFVGLMIHGLNLGEFGEVKHNASLL